MNIYDLPTSIEVKGKNYRIRHDFRPCLDIICAFEDSELTPSEKIMIMLEILMIDPIPDDKAEECIKKTVEFLDGGEILSGGASNKKSKAPRLYLWQKDAPYIFSGIDKTLGYNSRQCKYLHWWEFLGAFMDMGEGMFSNILHLRRAKQKGKLTNEERQYYNDNIGILSLKTNNEKRAHNDLYEQIREMERRRK